MLAAGRGHQRLPRLQRVLAAVERETAPPLEHDVDLVLTVVGVHLLALARLEAVEIDLGTRRGREGDLRHLVGLVLRAVGEPDLHRSSHRIARASSVTGCTSSRSSPRARAPRAICMRQPGLPVTTVRAPVSTIRDRKSTRLNSSHANISYAVFCLKKKKPEQNASPAR